MHTLLPQSALLEQLSPGAQAEHVEPQSTSVSEPFFTPSEQLGAWHSSAAQTALAQSEPTEHSSPIPHGVQPLPQSTSVSLPLCTVSEQVAA